MLKSDTYKDSENIKHSDNVIALINYILTQ